MSKLEHLRPSGLHHNPAYSHVVVASGARTIYIAGQVSTDDEGRVVGEGDLAAQTTQVMHNIGLALKAAGAGYANIVKITTFVVGYKPELRPIIGYKGKDWLFAFNPILDWDLSNGLQSWEPTFVPSVKLNREVLKGISLGAEYYSDLGKIGHIEPWDKQDNRLYATIDVDMKPLVFNFGVGRGLTEASDKWTVKAIIEVPINQLSK
jgi:enamine deaminase RidA (YjgF/YER057c/UK114 family)